MRRSVGSNQSRTSRRARRHSLSTRRRTLRRMASSVVSQVEDPVVDPCLRGDDQERQVIHAHPVVARPGARLRQCRRRFARPGHNRERSSRRSRGGCKLCPRPPRTVVVVEAKLFARLSAGVRNAPYLRPGGADRGLHRRGPPPRRPRPRGDGRPGPLDRSPPRPGSTTASSPGTPAEAIRRKVRRRVEDYAGERDAWFRDWFEPTWRRIEVRCLSWEDIIEVDRLPRPEAGQVIDSFYGHCLHFNRPQVRSKSQGDEVGWALPSGPGRTQTEMGSRRLVPTVFACILRPSCRILYEYYLYYSSRPHSRLHSLSGLRHHQRWPRFPAMSWSMAARPAALPPPWRRAAAGPGLCSWNRRGTWADS